MNDTSPHYGRARITSYVATSKAVWRTAGFPRRYNGKWYMATAGHCTSGNGAITSPSESVWIGSVARDDWRNGSGSVRLSGQSCYSGDLAL